MKVGDLVLINHYSSGKTFIGLVLTLWEDEAEILWGDETIQWELTGQMEVINESR